MANDLLGNDSWLKQVKKSSLWSKGSFQEEAQMAMNMNITSSREF